MSDECRVLLRFADGQVHVWRQDRVDLLLNMFKLPLKVVED